MIKNYIYNSEMMMMTIVLLYCKPTIDKFVPSQDLCHLSYPSFTDFNPNKDIC